MPEPSPEATPGNAPSAPQPETVDDVQATGPFPDSQAPTLSQRARQPSVTGSAASEVQPPTVPGYEVLGELGRGGMGVVYKARHLALQRTVALKMIRDGGQAGPQELARFQAEGEAVARLSHPNIVQVYEVGEHQGQPYCALEFISGVSLARRLGGDPLPPREAARVLEALAEAMHLAHSRNVVHRDLKPANVLLSEDGTPKVTDFGLARHLDRDSGQTQTGAILGTPCYMAPEQASGQTHAAGPPADVYALGAILYECLTGEPPFKGASPLETMEQVRSQEPVPPSRRQPRCPRDLETICLKCLAKKPEKRYSSAKELADDLRRFLDGRPILARPTGLFERAVKWARRRPAAAALLGLVLLTALAVPAAALEYDRRVRETRSATRAVDLVRSLGGLETDHVPRVVEELADFRRWADPHLRRVLAAAPAESRERMHASLALLPVDAEQAPYLTERLLTCRPKELAVLRDALQPYQEEVAPRLWPVLLDGGASADRRLRAACALATYSPDDARWSAVSAVVVSHLTAEGPLAAGRWAEALKPARDALLAPLSALARARTQSEADRALAAGIVADYAADRPEVLADLLQDADARQFPALFARLSAHRPAAVALLTQILARRPLPRWEDGPRPGAGPPPPDLARRLEQADGMMTEQFALCQTLLLSQFDALSGELRGSGYRPVCVRPYPCAAGLLVAAVWTRDGGDAVCAHGLTARQVHERDEAERRRGLAPLDVAGYASAEGDRFAAVWAALPPGVTEHRLLVGLADPEHEAAWKRLQQRDFVPLTHQRFVGRGRVLRNSQVWQKRAPTAWQFRNGPENLYEQQTANALSLVQTDVCLARSLEHEDQARQELAGWLTFAPGHGLAGLPWRALQLRSETASLAHPERWYSAAWQGRAGWESTEVHGLRPAEHRARCRGLADQGYRPVSLMVAEIGAPGEPAAASVWQRPVVHEAARAALASRQANAATALFRLGETAAVWSLLRHTPDPTVRTCLVHRLAPLGADPQALSQRLREEPDVSARRALILSLGEFPESRLSAAARAPLAARLLQDYRTDPDPGVHSAIDWLLRQRWGQGEKLRAADQALGGQPAGERHWFVNGQGQTLALVPQPGEYICGTSRADPVQRRAETLHRCRIDRSFALATREVTAEQFRRFLTAHPKVAYTLIADHQSAGPEGPVIAVSWYQAAAYCRWLSEQEHVSPEQMCYPEVAKIKPGVELPADYLSRTGYRLPTEAEWEYACRAGAATSRFHGCGEEMLGQYSWFLHNSGDQTWPCGRLKPNDLGLFDMLGNVREWCQNQAGTLPINPLGPAIEDRESTLRVRDGQGWVLRGGSFLDYPLALRSSARGFREAADRNLTLGLRVARTWRGTIHNPDR